MAGVAIGTVTADADLLDLVRDTFRSWTALLTRQLHDAGIPAPRAASIAVTTLAGMEGALILCRAEGSTEPLNDVAAELIRLLQP